MGLAFVQLISSAQVILVHWYARRWGRTQCPVSTMALHTAVCRQALHRERLQAAVLGYAQAASPEAADADADAGADADADADEVAGLLPVRD